LTGLVVGPVVKIVEGVMNKEILDHLKNYCEKNGFSFDGSDEDIIETLLDSGKNVYREVIDEKRWWNDVFDVVELDGMLIGFRNAVTTGDSSPEDVGWEFDSDYCCKVEKREETKIVVSYVKVD
jgi:hypothetical protein